MRRELFTSFVRGARIGLLVVGSLLVLPLLVVLAVVSTEPVPDKTGSATINLNRIGEHAPEEPRWRELDLALLKALAQHDESTWPRDLPHELSREEPAVAIPIPSVEPSPVTTPTVAPVPALTVTPAPVAPARVVTIPEGELYELLAASFPEEPARAHRIVMCESSGNAGANTGNGYYGMWQFDVPTWQAVGGSGLPSAASMDEQIMRARMLYDIKGWAPWGGCAR